MSEQILKLILKYKDSSIPENHYAISDLMNQVEKEFEYRGATYVLHVLPVTGIHNIQLFKFFISEIKNP